jgi:hypothetical protein
MAARKSRRKDAYRVFVSHAGDDIWVAEQIARSIEACGATAFLDRRDIAVGDNFRRRLYEEIGRCDELLALFTPWSRRRAWVRHEIGMADSASSACSIRSRSPIFRATKMGLAPWMG